MFSAAISYVPLEIVGLFCGDERCNTEMISKGFVVAADAGQLAIMKYLQQKHELDESVLMEAFKRAAGCGQIETAEQLYFEVDQILSSTFEEAAIIGVVIFLSTAKDEGLRCSDIDDQVGVMEVLYLKGCISFDVIVEVFPEASRSSSVDAVEFLYPTASIPTYVMDEAFQNAADLNCAKVVDFLYKTGEIFSMMIEETVMITAQDEDMYFVECLFNCGGIPQELLDKDAQSTPPASLFHLFLSRIRNSESVKRTKL
ncbi:hypothetical protein F444_10879 [Phytophthora nicotianae P1976]|uniref:Uncharacterized protein n=2 Tax=Phytophthora nicotianae TaxID=4792 RepID=A0A081A2P5_PHYNI|nr:hypothetical protein F444_10879 [Phytophthora nicotianae P1976]